MAESSVSIGGVAFTVYGSQVGIDEYMKGHSDAAAWVAADGNTKNRARVTAARSFDRMKWLGTPTDPTTPQALQWPRDGVKDSFGQDTSGVTPPAIEKGNWEWALELVKNGAIANATPGTNTKRTRTSDQVDVIKVEVETEFFKSTIGRSTRFPVAVQELVQPYLAGSSSRIGFASGTAEVSVFTTDDLDFGFSGIGMDGGANS